MAAIRTKLTIARGKTSKDVVVAAGAAISGGNKIEVNIDAENITKRELVDMLDQVKRRVIEGKWPLAQL
jgi:hypothetical protein